MEGGEAAQAMAACSSTGDTQGDCAATISVAAAGSGGAIEGGTVHHFRGAGLKFIT